MKQTKKRFTRIFSLLLCVLLCAALAVPAFAEGDAITVYNFEELLQAVKDVKPGGTINAYRDPKAEEKDVTSIYEVTKTLDIGTPCTINFNNVQLQQKYNIYEDGLYFKGSFIEVNADNVTLNFSGGYITTNCLSKENGYRVPVSTARGSAIHVDGDNCSISGKDGFVFNGCGTTAYYGGAIYIDDTYENCYIVGCKFVACEADSYGGAIYASSDGCTVKDCVFENCKADGVDSYVYSEEKYQTTLFGCMDTNGNPLTEKNCPYCVFRNRVDPKDGYYIIHAASDSALCLGIEGGANAKDSGAHTQLQKVAASGAKVFKIEKDKKINAYKIEAAHSEKSLGIEGTAAKNGTLIRQEADTGFWGQRWLFYDDGYGNVYISSYIGQKNYWMDVAGCDIRENVTVYVWSFTGAGNQKWTLETVKYDTSPVACPEEGSYKIYSALDGNYCLDISGGVEAQSDGDNLHLWPTDTAAANIFHLERDVNKDAYIIRAEHSGKILDVSGGDSAPGANIMQWNDDGDDDQRWVFKDADGKGHYYIRTLQNGYMDVQNGAAYEDANVYCAAFSGANSQMWVLEKLENAEPIPDEEVVEEIPEGETPAEEVGEEDSEGETPPEEVAEEIPEEETPAEEVAEGTPEEETPAEEVGEGTPEEETPAEEVVEGNLEDASTLSEGNIWILCALGAAAVIAVGAIVIVKKKRKSASA